MMQAYTSKTAGTTWLEELIGLAASGGTSLDLVKDIYSAAFNRFDELCGPYSNVIDIDRDLLPSPEEFSKWNERKIVRSICHDVSCSDYDKNIRQLLHVGYKVAAEYGKTYLQALDTTKILSKNMCVAICSKNTLLRCFFKASELRKNHKFSSRQTSFLMRCKL